MTAAGFSFVMVQPGAAAHPLGVYLAAGFTYKPGWSFVLDPGAGIAAAARLLTITMDVPDVHQPARRILAARTYAVPHESIAVDTQWWARWLRERINEMEQHEIDEWFRVGGVPAFDPDRMHAPPP